MDRRKFLSLASFAGVSIAAQGAFGSPARFGTRSGLTPLAEPYRGPLVITINAAGGWDPTSLCDPKGAASDIDTDAMNHSFRTRDIGTTATGIQYAPLGSVDQPDYFHDFFTRHERRLLVINGVDTGTRGHEDGARHLWSGKLTPGYPSFAALVAASHGGDPDARYLSFGGYDETMLEVPHLRGEAPAGAFNPDRPAQASLLQAGGTLYASRTGADEFSKLQRYLPTLDTGSNPLIRQIQVAMAAYRAGITVAVNLELDGFDTHVDHDAEHIPRLCQLLAGLDFLVDEAGRQNIADDYVVIVGSEFGRSPGYNASFGKDHGAITSVMAFGAGIVGGRVVGATSERHDALPVDPRTLKVSHHGVRIEPKHLHHDLRRLAGIDGDERLQLYPLAVDTDDMPLFTGPVAADRNRLS